MHKLQDINLSVHINPQLLRQLWAYTTAAPGEISGIGEVDVHEHHLTIQQPLHILRQECSMGSTELDLDALADLITDYHEHGKNHEALRFWFHSHGEFGAFFSSTDDATIKQLTATLPVLVAGVVNVAGEASWRIIYHGISVDWSDRIPGPKPSAAEIDAVRPIIAERVTTSRFSWYWPETLHAKRWDYRGHRRW